MFSRAKIVIVLGLALAFGAPLRVASAASDSGADAGAPGDVAKLVENLSSRDASVRKRASERLIALGAGVREQVVKASKSDDPEQRAQAAQVLLHLPWWKD